MEIITLIVLILETILMWGLLTAAQFSLRKDEHRVARTLIFILKIILIPVSAASLESMEWSLPYVHGTILCATYIALIGDVCASFIEYIIRRIRSREDDGRRHSFDHRVGAPVAVTVCAIVLAFGIVNAETISPYCHEWQVDGLEREHTFAFASDLHVGASLSMDSLRDFCRQVNESDAEFLILGGDITDELTSYNQMVETYEILSTVDIPVYLVLGNHDRQPGAHYVGGRTYTDEQLYDAIDRAGIVLLTDEYVQVSSDLAILGREDLSMDSRKDWSELVNPYGGALIVADHQPYDNDQLKAKISSLQLSGHTHAGQLWPLQLMFNMIQYPANGDYDRYGTHLFVTPGLAGWAPLVRTDGHSGWELITIHP